jgi:hypothetical protein
MVPLVAVGGQVIGPRGVDQDHDEAGRLGGLAAGREHAGADERQGVLAETHAR